MSKSELDCRLERLYQIKEEKNIQNYCHRSSVGRATHS